MLPKNQTSSQLKVLFFPNEFSPKPPNRSYQYQAAVSDERRDELLFSLYELVRVKKFYLALFFIILSQKDS